MPCKNFFVIAHKCFIIKVSSVFQNDSFVGFPSKKKKFEYSIIVFIHMLNVSISTATLCGRSIGFV